MSNTCFSPANRFDAATELLRTAITIRILATVVQWIELSPPKGVIQVRFLSGAPPASFKQSHKVSKTLMFTSFQGFLLPYAVSSTLTSDIKALAKRRTIRILGIKGHFPKRLLA